MPLSCPARRSTKRAPISNPDGIGVFQLAEWTIDQRVVFEKTADHWRGGLPYLDGVTFEVGQEPIVALLRLQQEEVDVPGDGIPPPSSRR